MSDRSSPDRIHGPRRTPETPDQPVDLEALAHELLDQAAGLDAGRAGRTLTPGVGVPLNQTVLALTAGRRLQEHRAPGPATVHVLVGTALLGLPSDRMTLSAGMWAIIPAEPHELEAVSDTAVVLTVTPRR